MPSNVEIKARLTNKRQSLEVARRLSQSEGTLLKQEDTFYNVSNGRLKLRVEGMASSGKLISYSRPDKAGPKLSQFSIAHIQDAVELDTVLTLSLGVLGQVKKERLLFLVGQTRIHIDMVEQLGDFLELEVVMREGQAVSEGEEIARDLMDQLGVRKGDLITGAYMDLLLQQREK